MYGNVHEPCVAFWGGRQIMWSLCSLQHKSTNGALHQPVELHVHVCVRASFSHFASKHQCDQANLHTHMPSCDPLPTQLAVVDSSLKLH